eukprot:NODE_1368_length_1565_cov_54.450528_g1230_i0.p1 GENE.NODE_1368_length_1565_cov_54.450528_g1230_i0~~NODE_1368_length_1565_cov_54.450528_g1230_i0.p1  ORF type:complete len:454 (+),score=54.26 NODE_1368_length_1565_cov_54.450528_g1230_i0:49-1410(+)
MHRFMSLGCLLVLLAIDLAAAGHGWKYDGRSVRGTLREPAVDPGICDTVKQRAGFYDIDDATDKHYFYWTFASRNPNSTTTILWMTGGPGCSSELALFAENGPCKISADGTKTISNPFSWNTDANLVFIDQPAGTGFSYSGIRGHDTNEKEVAEDMFHFLQDFFRDHPIWIQGDFYIFGESYGGHFVPATAHRLWQGNMRKEGLFIPLSGIAVGNGLTNPEIQYQYYAEMAYTFAKEKLGKPIVSEATYNRMTREIPTCVALIKECQAVTAVCPLALRVCNAGQVSPFSQSGLNPYDIRIKCLAPPLCDDYSHVDHFLSAPVVRSALNATSPWSACNFRINAAFGYDWMKNFQNQIPDLLSNSIRVLIYAGDVDFICNWVGNKAWTLAMDWPGKAGFNAAADNEWRVDGRVAGELRAHANFSFLRVMDAGHMVPKDRPDVALEMVRRYIAGRL